jgi:hypothetical protein
MIPMTTPETARPVFQALAVSLVPPPPAAALPENGNIHRALRAHLARDEGSSHASAGAPDAKR